MHVGCGVWYESGAFGLSQENTFKNFTHASMPCIDIAFSYNSFLKGLNCRPRLMNNTYENCTEFPLPQQD